MVSKALGGAILPGRPIANLFFAQYCHQVVEVVGTLAGNLKMGQYLKIPPCTMLVVQVVGSLMGGYIRWYVMSGISDRERDILLDPFGNNKWYGGYYQVSRSR